MPKAKTLLIVEDNLEFRELLRIILAKAGYRVLTAPNGLVGFEMARRERPDMVLLDLQMPQMDGYQTCRAIRAEPGIERTPIILISVLANPKDVIEGLKLGADDYINKPFDTQEVLARVGALFRQAGSEA